MAGYLEEKSSPEGHIHIWQTPNRQRWWGLAIAVLPAAFLIYSLRDISQVNTLNVIVGAVALFGAALVALRTQRFKLNTRYGTYEDQHGFLPVMIGDKGNCKDAFQCVALRQEELIDAAKHENDPLAESFHQYRIFLIWKNARKEAFLIDTMPLNYQESVQQKDFRKAAQEKANKLAKELEIEFLDQTAVYAAVETISEEESVTQK